MTESAVNLPVDFQNVQAHYDLCDEFFALFLDPSRTYSCGKFDKPESTLAEAQLAKIDLSLGKCEIQPGQRLLDIGCGWGAASLRAANNYGAQVTGLTLSQNQLAYCQKLGAKQPRVSFRLQGWETFEEKVDRIVSIGAFEHFGRDKYAAFFARCHDILASDGVMLLHTITLGKPSKAFAFLRFVHFISVKIFPGGDVPPPERVIEFARAAGFELVHAESLRPHYAKTLDYWAANLSAAKEAAIALVGQVIFDTYMKYLTSCANYFRSGECNVYQFKFRV